MLKCCDRYCLCYQLPVGASLRAPYWQGRSNPLAASCTAAPGTATAAARAYLRGLRFDYGDDGTDEAATPETRPQPSSTGTCLLPSTASMLVIRQARRSPSRCLQRAAKRCYKAIAFMLDREADLMALLPQQIPPTRHGTQAACSPPGSTIIQPRCCASQSPASTASQAPQLRPTARQSLRAIHPLPS